MATGPKLRLSVQTKVLIPVLGCLVLLPLAMVWLVNSYLTRAELADGRTTLSSAEGVFRQALESKSRDLLLRLNNSASEPHFVALAQKAELKDDLAINTVREQLRDRREQAGEDCDAVFFTAISGSLPIAPRPGLRLTNEEFEAAAGAFTAQALQGDPAVGPINLKGSAYWVVSLPVNLPGNGERLGALTYGVRLSEAALQEFKRLTNTQILLIAGGQAIASTLPTLDSGRWAEGVAPEGAAASASIRSQLVSIKGEHYLALSGSYPGAGRAGGFHYELLSSFEETLRAQEDMTRMMIEISVLGILISATAIWFFVRRFTHPLSDLVVAAEAVGRGDFTRKIVRFSNDECGDLADAFNRMTTSLQSSRADLEKAVQTLKNTQEQLIQSEKLSAVGQFVAGVAHELNNPLTAVIGFSELLSQTGTDEAIRPHLDLIAKSALRCHKIVQNLLSFARQHPPERKLVQLHATIDEVLDLMAYDLRTSNIAIVREFQGDLPAILGDPYQLQQVFVNIVGNARQAIQAFRPDGQITVRTRAEEKFVRIEFGDNGPGIRPENLSRIFDPFFTTKAVGKGTGLGLSLTYGIVQEHGGRIRVESQLGQGATFVIELPISGSVTGRGREPDHAAALGPRARQPSGRAVLVIDDEEWILTLARQLLQHAGHAAETVLGAEDGIAALRRRTFDVIVCDWKMPGMNGMQFYEHLLADQPALADRVIFMSGDVINDSFQDFLRRHGKVCLPKPFPIEEFQMAVARQLLGEGAGLALAAAR